MSDEDLNRAIETAFDMTRRVLPGNKPKFDKHLESLLEEQRKRAVAA